MNNYTQEVLRDGKANFIVEKINTIEETILIKCNFSKICSEDSSLKEKKYILWRLILATNVWLSSKSLPNEASPYPLMQFLDKNF